MHLTFFGGALFKSRAKHRQFQVRLTVDLFSTYKKLNNSLLISTHIFSLSSNITPRDEMIINYI